MKAHFLPCYCSSSDCMYQYLLSPSASLVLWFPEAGSGASGHAQLSSLALQLCHDWGTQRNQLSFPWFRLCWNRIGRRCYLWDRQILNCLSTTHLRLLLQVRFLGCVCRCVRHLPGSTWPTTAFQLISERIPAKLLNKAISYAVLGCSLSIINTLRSFRDWLMTTDGRNEFFTALEHRWLLHQCFFFCFPLLKKRSLTKKTQGWILEFLCISQTFAKSNWHVNAISVND